MSESQYKQYRAAKFKAEGKPLKASNSLSRQASDHSGMSGHSYEDDDLGTGSGMDDYDQASDIGV